MNVREVKKVRLWGFSETIETPVRSMLFGELVKLAFAVPVTGYTSDLYHDAMWVERNINGPCEFWYIARNWGTHIGTDSTAFESVLSVYESVNAYRLTLAVEDGSWNVTIEREV